MHFALGIQQFPVAAVSGVTKQFLPPINGHGYLIETAEQAFYTPTGLVFHSFAIYEAPVAI
jgi:hypothetical protein